MKIGLNTDGVRDLSLEETLDLAAELKLDYVEFATGNWSSAPHLKLDQMLDSASERERLQGMLKERDLKISALTCSGNPLDPGPAGPSHREVTDKTIELAGLLGVDRVVMMSGLPGGPGDTHPNWVVVGWPPETHDLLEWQWNDQVIPYWKDLVSRVEKVGDIRLCLELHAQQVVFNVPTMHRLREAVGTRVGANLDPSHLMWMGADPIESIKALGDAIFHVHAKDTRIEGPSATRTVLETMPLFGVDPADRAWNYVFLGDGHDETFWRQFCDELRAVGYDEVLSIEHEDTRMTPVEGIVGSAELLRRVTAPVGAAATA
jgi:sugar phosphate isomerase/epimerase